VQPQRGTAFLDKYGRFAAFPVRPARVRSGAMENGSSLVRVLGIGHFAAAVRVHLQHVRLFASHMDCQYNSERAALFLACSDFENSVVRRSLAERARADHATLLFACLTGRTARVGPLITPVATDNSFAHHLTRSWDFSPATFVPHQTHATDARQIHLAQIGATFVIGELAKIMFGHVTKIDSPTSYFGEGLSQGLPEVHAGTMVAGRDDWREAAHLPVRTWHPAEI
jgi:hypothetical protein